MWEACSIVVHEFIDVFACVILKFTIGNYCYTHHNCLILPRESMSLSDRS